VHGKARVKSLLPILCLDLIDIDQYWPSDLIVVLVSEKLRHVGTLEHHVDRFGHPVGRRHAYVAERGCSAGTSDRSLERSVGKRIQALCARRADGDCRLGARAGRHSNGARRCDAEMIADMKQAAAGGELLFHRPIKGT